MGKLATALLAVLAALSSPAGAQDMPKRVTLLVGYPAGGSTDIVARMIAEKIAPKLNAAVVVENSAGASGMLAAHAVARAPKDGSMLLFAASNEVTILPALKKKMPYDKTAFAPVALVGMVPLVLAVHPSSPASSVAELIALARKDPGRLSYASFGAGTSNHLTAELFKSVTGTDIVHVPYKGGAAALPDLLSGRVELCFHAIQVALPYIRSGQLKAIGYTGGQRSPLMPDVPTMEEAGLPGFVVGSWVGLLAPAGTPAPVVTRLDAEVRSLVATPEMQKSLEAQGTAPAYKSAADFTSFIDAEIARWADVGTRAQISLD